VSALRWLLIGVPTNLALDTGVLVGATVAGITVSSLLLPRLARRAGRRGWPPAGRPPWPHGAVGRGGSSPP
jgi:hypothetical protein